MRAIDIGLIQARRTRLVADIESHRKVITELEAKLSELEIAERVFAELSLETSDDTTPHPISTQIDVPFESEGGDALNDQKEQRIKPPGIPTVSEMILEALRHAHGLGAEGLEPAGITSYIRGRYWPNAPAERISPIVWRMWSKDQLEKHGTLYALRENERPHTAGDKLRAVGAIPAHARLVGEDLPALEHTFAEPAAPRPQIDSLLEGVSSVALNTGR